MQVPDTARIVRFSTCFCILGLGRGGGVTHSNSLASGVTRHSQVQASPGLSARTTLQVYAKANKVEKHGRSATEQQEEVQAQLGSCPYAPLNCRAPVIRSVNLYGVESILMGMNNYAVEEMAVCITVLATFIQATSYSGRRGKRNGTLRFKQNLRTL